MRFAAPFSRLRDGAPREQDREQRSSGRDTAATAPIVLQMSAITTVRTVRPAADLAKTEISSRVA